LARDFEMASRPICRLRLVRRYAGCHRKSKEGHVKISWLTPAYDAGKRIQLVSVMGGRVEFDRLAGEIRAPAAVAPRSIPGRFQRQPLRAGSKPEPPRMAAADPGETDQLPAQTPCSITASSVYSEQLGNSGSAGHQRRQRQLIVLIAHGRGGAARCHPSNATSVSTVSMIATMRLS